MTIVVTGATGFLGKRVCLLLNRLGLEYTPTSLSLGCDLRSYESTLEFFSNIHCTEVINCASFTGGIQFGLRYPADIFRNNLPIILNLLEACHATGVRRIVNPISNCVYPSQARMFRESEIWDGPLDETVMVYAMLRKISWVGGWAYSHQYNFDTLNLVLSNMYGPDDHFEEERSHALGALVMKFVEAQRQGIPEVRVWGSGKPIREWLYVDDGAEALVRGINAKASRDFINVGVGKGISVRDLAEKIKTAVGFQGDIVFDTAKPDGALHKTVDGMRGMELLGWSPSVKIDEGIALTVAWYKDQVSFNRKSPRK